MLDVYRAFAEEVVAMPGPPSRLIIWVSSRPTPPAAACTTVTAPSATGNVLRHR